MNQHHIDFGKISWESPIPGMRQKGFESGPKRVRLVEYTREMEPHWCSRGHYGYVLDGRLELEFDDAVKIYEAGDGVFIPDGEEHRHRGKVLSEIVRVIFVEDV